MIKKDLTSVIIPCYNQGQFLAEAVNSVIEQTYKEWECLIIDDGSTDKTADIAEELTEKDNRIKYYYQENKGLPAARNNGFEKSTGEYIHFLDADDLIHPQKISKQVEILNNDKSIDISYTDYSFFSEDISDVYKRSLEIKLSENPLDDLLHKWEREFSIPIHTALFRRSILKTQPFNESMRAKEDWVMWVELALKETRFEYLNKEYCYYRKHSLNQTADIKEMCSYFIRAVLVILPLLPVEKRELFINESLSHINSVYLNISYRTSLFYDTGSGFNAENVITKFVAREHKRDIEIKYCLKPGVSYINLRFDPCEGFFSRVRLKNINLYLETGKKKNLALEKITSNGVLGAENEYIFLTSDPSFYLNSGGSIKRVEVNYEIEILNYQQVEKYINKYYAGAGNKLRSGLKRCGVIIRNGLRKMQKG